MADRLGKVTVVLVGYFAAFALALIVVSVRIAKTPFPEVQGGMAAFGDSILFMAVFGVVALLPTGLWLHYLRPYRWFWMMLAAACALTAATAAAAIVLFHTGRDAPASTLLGLAGGLAILRLFPTPILAGLYLLAGVLAPFPGARWTLLGACAVEGAVFGYWVLTWWLPSLSR